MLDRAAVEPILKEVLSARLGIPAEPYDLTPLAGDASNRRYYRLHSRSSGKGPTVIVMELAEPEAFKKSEEQVSGGPAQITELPFVNVHRHLERCGVSVPRLYHYEEKKGWLFLEDFGNRTLWEALKDCPPDHFQAYYRLAIDELLKIHEEGTRRTDPDCIAFARAFDLPLLLWEFDHFLEYGIEAARGTKITAGDRAQLRAEFEKAIRPLLQEAPVLTHRDYHSRNLMVRDGRLGVLDFQDALLGPAVYDLASLLRDAYITLPQDLIEELLIYYLERRQDPGGRTSDRGRWVRQFDLISLQRSLKAAGRFVYIQAVKGNSNYLQFIPRTLANAGTVLKKYPDLKELHGLLSRYVEELK